MGHLTAWISLAVLVLVCAAATTIAKRVAYGDSRAFDALSPSDFEARSRRARSAGWTCALVWIFLVIIALWVFWPPTGWIVGLFAATAVLLVAVLIGLNDPRSADHEERFDE